MSVCVLVRVDFTPRIFNMFWCRLRHWSRNLISSLVTVQFLFIFFYSIWKNPRGFKKILRNPCYHTYFWFWLFGQFLAGKWAWPPWAPLMIWIHQTQLPKGWSTGWTFWVNCYLEIMFFKFAGLNPLPSYKSIDLVDSQDFAVLLCFQLSLFIIT